MTLEVARVARDFLLSFFLKRWEDGEEGRTRPGCPLCLSSVSSPPPFSTLSLRSTFDWVRKSSEFEPRLSGDVSFHWSSWCVLKVPRWALILSRSVPSQTSVLPLFLIPPK